MESAFRLQSPKSSPHLFARGLTNPSTGFVFFTWSQDLSNLLVEEDKVEEEITDVESELEILRKQVHRPVSK